MRRCCRSGAIAFIQRNIRAVARERGRDSRRSPSIVHPDGQPHGCSGHCDELVPPADVADHDSIHAGYP
eukprot:scaffold1593_cov143-Isochrysis_galbana.AAC.3